MAIPAVLALTCVMVLSASEVIFVKQQHGATQTLQITDNNTVLRTQFFPVEIERDGAERRVDILKCATQTNEEIKARNSSYQVREGKLYKVTRVKKKISKEPCEPNSNNRAQRRNSQAEGRSNTTGQSGATNVDTQFVNIFPSLSSSQWQANKTKTSQSQSRNLGSALYNILPQLSSGHWQTMDNHTAGAKADAAADRSWKFWTSSHPITSKTIARKKEKIKKLLNLFTIVKFDNEGCHVDGLKGTCYHQNECAERGGAPMGPCARGFGVCCYIERTCGQTTAENCTYFVNEGFPQPTTQGPGICALSVIKAHPDVRQLRIEFQTFELRGPVNGSCLIDRFLVTGQNRNSIVPDMCGVNTGQHIYVDVDATSGPYNLNMVTMGQEPGRKWRVKVTQLRPGNELLAPHNCLQYFTQLTGVVESFNYHNFNTGNAGEASPGYFNNLNYDICIKKSPAFCSVTYSNQPDGMPESDFQLINFDKAGEPLIPRGQAGAEVFNCPDDYIIVNGVRLCGDRLNDATVELDYTKSSPVTDLSAGPARLSVRTDQENVSRGFRLTYQQNPCLD